jgi:hypothetical protein
MSNKGLIRRPALIRVILLIFLPLESGLVDTKLESPHPHLIQLPHQIWYLHLQVLDERKSLPPLINFRRNVNIPHPTKLSKHLPQISYITILRETLLSLPTPSLSSFLILASY